ncbi:hypothetical protein [Chryseobacterium tongliaoense]|uniref:hypothetical protein n=1 Tax=Chryseobacterium tongliaoense TaxID=3240933 RepID=UPI00351295D6
MEIPLYYNFKEFDENYNKNLKIWLNNYPDADEIDYLNELRSQYILFFYQNNFDFIINSNWIRDEYPENYELSITAYQEFMQEKLIQYLHDDLDSNFDGDNLEISLDTNVMDFWEDCNVWTRKNSAIIDDEKHKYLKEFFTFDNYTKKLVFDEKKFTNFKYAIKRIIEYLDKKTHLISSTIKNEPELNNNSSEVLNSYQNAQSENEKIEIVAEYIFELSKKYINGNNDLIDEEIDDLYFDTISKLKEEIIAENSTILKYKLYKTYELPSKEDYKPTEYSFYAEDLYRTHLKIREQNDVLSTIERGIILNNVEFREYSDGNGFFHNKKKIGYKVFLKFKKLWKLQNQKSINQEIIVENTNISPIYQKIKIKGSLQSIGYLFSELIDKGFIEAPKRNGKNNTSAISRMILEHFEFVDKEEQPNAEDVRKTLFTDNKLSLDKQDLFKIPNQKTINEN